MTEFIRKYKFYIAAGAAVLLAAIILAAIPERKEEPVEETEETIASISSLTPEELAEMRKEELLQDITSEYERTGSFRSTVTST